MAQPDKTVHGAREADEAALGRDGLDVTAHELALLHLLRVLDALMPIALLLAAGCQGRGHGGRTQRDLDPTAAPIAGGAGLGHRQHHRTYKLARLERAQWLSHPFVANLRHVRAAVERSTKLHVEPAPRTRPNDLGGDYRTNRQLARSCAGRGCGHSLFRGCLARGGGQWSSGRT